MLLNRSHQFHDLILVLDRLDTRMFEVIDGHRTIAEVADCIPEVDQRKAREFFEKLWWYDQVVFDTSNARQQSNASRRRCDGFATKMHRRVNPTWRGYHLRHSGGF